MMDAELLLVLGVAIGILSVPAVISAFSSGRPPRGAVIAAVVGGGLILFATLIKPGGFRADELPQIVARVVQRYMP